MDKYNRLKNRKQGKPQNINYFCLKNYMIKDLKENTACGQFEECQKLGIVNLEPDFDLNGIEFYSFTGDYDTMPTLRYLQIQSSVNSFEKFGMTYEVAKDYVEDAIEQLLNVNVDDHDIKDKLNSLLITLKVFKSHQKELDQTGLLLELASLVYIMKKEDPYKVDFNTNAEKITLWANAIAAEGEQGRLLPFFSKSLNLQSAGLTKLFSQFNMLSTQVKSESQIAEANLMRNSLILDIARLQEGLQGSTQLSPLRKAVRGYRATLGVANLMLKS
jgi:hypothetical protein